MSYILLLSTASQKQAAGLARGNQLWDWITWRQSLLHPQNPLVKIEKLLKRNRVPPEKLAGVIFNQGPGSFTSLRNTAAITNGFNLALGTKIAAVSYFELLLWRAKVQTGLVLIPSGRGDFFAASFSKNKKPSFFIIASSQLTRRREKNLIILGQAGLLPPSFKEQAPFLPENKQEELWALLVLGQKRLKKKALLTPLYLR